MVADLGFGFRCSWSDYRGWRTRNPNEPRPSMHWRDFPDLAAAQRECERQRIDGMTACISAVPPPRPGLKRREKLPPGPWPVQHRALYT
jgi:hypothetical protein